MARQTDSLENNVSDSKLPKTAYLYLGPPVVGKDAQTDAFEVNLGIPVFKTGPVLKDIAARNPGGPEDEALKSRDLASDGTAVWAAKRWIYQNKAQRLIKLNGIPRTVGQMKIINFLRERGFAPRVIWFTTPIEVCINRPLRPDRDDETPASRARRMEIYLDKTHPIIAELENYGISENRGNLLLIDNTHIQKHQVAEKIIQTFQLPFQVSQVFPQTERPAQLVQVACT